jgi:hypothetical protein
MPQRGPTPRLPCSSLPSAVVQRSLKRGVGSHPLLNTGFSMKPVHEATPPRARTLTPEDVSRTERAPSSLVVVLGTVQAQRLLEGRPR